MSEEEQLNSMVLELRVLESYLNEVANREAIASRALLDSRAALETLGTLPKNDNAEVLFPIGGGLFIPASAPPAERILVSIGANIVVEKARGEAVSYVEERIKEMERAITSLAGQRLELTKKINETRAAINALVAKLQKQQGA